MAVVGLSAAMLPFPTCPLTSYRLCLSPSPTPSLSAVAVSRNAGLSKRNLSLRAPSPLLGSGLWLCGLLSPVSACSTSSTNMGKRTKKVGICGKYGTRYGASLRKVMKKIEISQHSKVGTATAWGGCPCGNGGGVGAVACA